MPTRQPAAPSTTRTSSVPSRCSAATSFVAPQLNASAAVIDSALGHRTGLWNPAIYAIATCCRFALHAAERHHPRLPQEVSEPDLGQGRRPGWRWPASSATTTGITPAGPEAIGIPPLVSERRTSRSPRSPSASDVSRSASTSIRLISLPSGSVKPRLAAGVSDGLDGVAGYPRHRRPQRLGRYRRWWR